MTRSDRPRSSPCLATAPGSALLVALVLASAGSALAQSAAESATVRSATAGATAKGASSAGRAVGRRVAAASAQAPASAPTEPTQEVVIDQGPVCVGGLPQPTQIRINAGKATLINLPEPIARRTLGDPQIADGRLVSPQVLYLVSGRIGTTNAILQGRSGQCIVLDIVVALDTDAVQAKLSELLPAEKNIRVTAAGDSLILVGTVADATVAERVAAIANAYVRTAYQQGIGASAGGGAGGRAQNATAGGAPLSARIINMLMVGSPQQVMLEVKVAEVSKTLLDKLGVRVAGTQTRGTWTYQLISDLLIGGTGATLGANRNIGNGVMLDADKRDGLVRILAEPTVMAISGQEGSFLAGGKIFIPVSQTSDQGVSRIALEEKEFGVGLKFTPTVLADGRINLRVAPEVSELSREGVGISASNIGGNAILPLINTRRAATTVQLLDGQSFAIGGLIRNTTSATINALPFLGEIPVLGALFRSTDYQEDRTELVFVVTPRLVKPLPPNYELPTDRVGPPTRQGLLIDGRLDNPVAAPAPSGTPTPSRSGGMELK